MNKRFQANNPRLTLNPVFVQQGNVSFGYDYEKIQVGSETSTNGNGSSGGQMSASEAKMWYDIGKDVVNFIGSMFQKSGGYYYKNQRPTIMFYKSLAGGQNEGRSIAEPVSEKWFYESWLPTTEKEHKLKELGLTYEEIEQVWPQYANMAMRISRGWVPGMGPHPLDVVFNQIAVDKKSGLVKEKLVTNLIAAASTADKDGNKQTAQDLYNQAKEKAKAEGVDFEKLLEKLKGETGKASQAGINPIGIFESLANFLLGPSKAKTAEEKAREDAERKNKLLIWSFVTLLAVVGLVVWYKSKNK